MYTKMHTEYINIQILENVLKINGSYPWLESKVVETGRCNFKKWPRWKMIPRVIFQR